MRNRFTRFVPPEPRTYHFHATAGNDANSGAADSPRQTIAGANTLALNPGDRVLFAAGETWTNTRFTIPGSGKSGRPIIIGKYGTGANPIINHNVGYNIYVNARQWVVLDSIDVTSAQSNGVNILNSSSIWCQNMDISGFSLATPDGGIRFSASSANGLTHHINVAKCTIHDADGWGVIGSDYATYSCVLQDLNISDIGATAVPQTHGLYVSNHNDLVIDRCVIDQSYYKSIKIIGTTNSIIRRCTLTNHGRAAGSGQGVGFGTGCSYVTIENCLIAFGKVGDGIGTDNTGDDVDYITILSNTIVENYSGIMMPTGATGWVIKNNCVYQDAAWLASTLRTPLNVTTAADIPNNTFDNNNWYFRNGGGVNNPIKVAGSAESFATWQARASAPDASGISANPVFVADFTDLHLQVTSPNIAAGAVVGMASDRDDVLRGVAYDIGCFEYV